MNFRVVADSDVIVDRNVRMNAHPITYYHILADRHVSIDENFFRNTRARVNYCGGVPVRLEICFGLKNDQSTSKSQVGIFSAQHSEIRAGYFYVLVDIDRGSARRRNLVRVFRIEKEGDFAGLRVIKSGGGVDFDVASAECALGAGLRCQVEKSHRRGSLPHESARRTLNVPT